MSTAGAQLISDTSGSKVEGVSGTGPVPEFPPETTFKRLIFSGLAICLAIGYGVVLFHYWTPSHPGVDQNGYLVGGKMFAQTLSMAQKPVRIGHPQEFDPHQFVGDMWVSGKNDPQTFYPKYPLGLPFLYAVAMWIGGHEKGVVLAHLISPLTMSLSMLGVYFLARLFTTSFPAVLGMLVIMTSPIINWCANNPNSHATTLFCCVWGMICVIRWWKHGGWGWALVGGLLTGYAATIRYTEAALILPLLWVVATKIRWSCKKTWIESVILIAAWMLPVLLLLIYNRIDIGTWTAYDVTNESTGFSWAFFTDNWSTLLRQLNENGLFFLFPVAVAGLVTMFWWKPKIAVFFCLWIGPCLTLYMFYYWAPDTLGYLRFVITALPGMVIAAFWLIAHIRDLLPKEPVSIPVYLLLLVLTFGGLSAGILGHFAIRLDLPNLTRSAESQASERPWFTPVKQYLHPPETYSTFEHRYNREIFILLLVMLSAWGAALSAAIFLKKSIVPTLAAGILTFICTAFQTHRSLRNLERDAMSRFNQEMTYTLVRYIVPDHSVLICPNQALLHHLQFATNLICFTGQTFDKRWIDTRPSQSTEDPVLVDPVRGQQLQQILKNFDQQALTEQAHQSIRDALENRRRVFVLSSLSSQPAVDYRELVQKNPPDFIKRHIIRVNDSSLRAIPVAWWNIPRIRPETPPSRHRGPRELRQPLRDRDTAFQLWEITQNP
jgi:hypothetical protein